VRPIKINWFRRQQCEEELNAEIRNHLNEAIRDRIARGETPEEARAHALHEFGNVGLVKEVTREIWGWAGLGSNARGRICSLGCGCCEQCFGV
jgi:hypothetical protein